MSESSLPSEVRLHKQVRLHDRDTLTGIPVVQSRDTPGQKPEMDATLFDQPLPAAGAASMNDTVDEVLIPAMATPPVPAADEVIPIEEVHEADPLAEAFGQQLRGMREQVLRVAPQDTTILLTGETGTGKTRLARYIHDHSPRGNEPFMVVDCSALSPSLIESEMFGHVRGAFTGADRDRVGKFAGAGRGTLLLDEINSLPLPLQGKLLRAIDERVFEPVGGNKSIPLQARVITVSNVPLAQEVAEQKFRSDLYYRLNVIEFFLPPLRERQSVIQVLTKRFLAQFVSRNRPDIKGITAGTVLLLEQYGWPGNIRELRNVLERIVSLSAGPVLQPADLPESIRSAPPTAQRSEQNAALSLTQAKEEAEIWRIKKALEKHGNNRLRAAADLGISRMGLYKKLHKYRLT